jgi:undecaprenyl-diphosphatase
VTYLQSAVLGAVQGLTEFLPVSSSGHLILVPHLLGWPDQGLAFDAAIHLGTLGALVAYFWPDLMRMLAGADRRLAAILAAATVPAGLAGLAFEGVISAHLRSPAVVATSLVFWGLAMGAADRLAARRARVVETPAAIPWRAGLFVGCAQALALVPGTSRSGITITAGLVAGMSRVAAARFAFLLGIPITAAAGGVQLLSLLRGGLDGEALGPLAVGLGTSFLAGWVAVWFLIHFLQRRSLMPFVVYRCALGLVIGGVLG